MNLAEFNRWAFETFGVTDNPSEAGAILSNGMWLDFSGRHYHPDYVRAGDRFVPKMGKPDTQKNGIVVPFDDIAIFDQDPQHDHAWAAQEFGVINPGSCIGDIRTRARPTWAQTLSLAKFIASCKNFNRDPTISLVMQDQGAWDPGWQATISKRDLSVDVAFETATPRYLSSLFDSFYGPCQAGVPGCPHGAN